MKESELKKPEVNIVAGIIFSELFRNEGMTIVGKVEKIVPRIERLIELERLKSARKEAKYWLQFDHQLMGEVKKHIADLDAQIQRLQTTNSNGGEDVS